MADNSISPEETETEEEAETRPSPAAQAFLTQAKRYLANLGKIAWTALRSAFLALINNPYTWGILVIITVIILFVMVGVFLLTSLGGDNPPGTGTSRAQEPSAQELQSELPMLGALSGDESALRIFLANQDNVKILIQSLEKALASKDKLPKKDQVVPIFEELIARLKVYIASDSTKDQKRAAFNQIRSLADQLRAIPPYLYDPAALAATKKIQIFKPNDKIGIFSTGIIARASKPGFDPKTDGAVVILDTRIPRLLHYLATKGSFSLGVSSIVGTHSKNVKGKTTESRHWRGHAMDISQINSKSVISSKENACALMKFIQDNLDEIKNQNINPKQVIGPDQCAQRNLAIHKGQPDDLEVDGHENHVHIGF